MKPVSYKCRDLPVQVNLQDCGNNWKRNKSESVGHYREDRARNEGCLHLVWPNWLEIQGSWVGLFMRRNCWWSCLLLWYNPVHLQNVHAVLFPGCSSFLALIPKCHSVYIHSKSPFLAMKQDLFIAILCPSGPVFPTSLLNFLILLSIWWKDANFYTAISSRVSPPVHLLLFI